MKILNYTSLDAVFVRLSRMGFNDVSEKDVIENSGDALQAIGAIGQYQQAVCFAEVKNHQLAVPNGCHSIIQIARNTCFTENPNLAICPLTAQNECRNPTQDPFTTAKQLLPYPYLPPGSVVTTTELSNPDPAQGVLLDCNGQPIQVNELAYYRPYFDLQWEYLPFTNSLLYRQCFRPVRLTEHTMFNSIVCEEKDRARIYEHSHDEYNIYGGLKGNLRFSFKFGQVAIAYNRPAIEEETGYPLIPDDISYISAAVYYNIMKFSEREFYAGRQGAKDRMETAAEQWDHYCGQAAANTMMISGEDEHQNFLNQRSYLLPRPNQYSSFFGRLNAPEDRKYNNPNRLHSNYFRGLADGY